MIYRNREHAARLLAEALQRYRGRRPLVLAIPRGPIFMGRILAEALGGELDVVLVRKIGAPSQPEQAIGAVDEHGEVYLTEAAGYLGVSQVYLREECRRQLSLLRARRRRYTPDRPPISPAGRIVIVLDDGVATGATMIAALRAIRDQHPEELIAAAAVMPPETYTRIANEADRVICLQTPAGFGSVGQFFEDFAQVTDEEVAAALLPGAPADQPASSRVSANPASGSSHWLRARNPVRSPSAVTPSGENL